ncbi:hypothetical protein GCM10027291_01490 [Telluribacter humicola]
MKDQLKDWFSYNHEANERFMEILTRGEGVPDKPLSLLSHILNAHQIWLDRIYTTGSTSRKPWQQIERVDLAATNNEVYQQTGVYLQAERFGMGLQRPITYSNTQGVRFENTIQEIYMHILFHSAYHRGQIALLLREQGIDPPLSDYIFFKRELQSTTQRSA